MKTAEYFLKEGVEGYPLRDVIDNIEDQDILDSIIEFAKYHVEQALKCASESAEIIFTGEGQEDYDIDKESILTAYPLTNIK